MDPQRSPHNNPPAQLLFPRQQSCEEIARETPEPYTSKYHHTHRLLNISESIWADYNWPGAITERDFIRARSSGMYGVFKVFKNKLYCLKTGVHEGPEVARFKESVLMALGLYDIPDVDFLVDYGRVQRHMNVPAIVFAFNSSTGKGFAAPSPDVVEGALGPTQMEMLERCLDQRYPAGVHRAPKGVWHGVSRPSQKWLMTSCKSISSLSRQAEDEIDLKFNVYTVSKDAGSQIRKSNSVAA